MMIVKTPLKEKNVRPNKRKKSPANGRALDRVISNGTGNGTVYGKPRKETHEKKLSFPNVSAWKVIVGAVILGALGVLYINHVFATQKLLREVQQMERTHEKAKRLHADYRLTYDRMIGPKEIYEKAKAMGFINGGPADKVLEVEAE